MNDTEPETPGTIDGGGMEGVPVGGDEPGVITEDITDFHREPTRAGSPSVGNKQARIVKAEPNRDVTAEGENRWFRGQLVRRRGGRWR